MKGLKTTLFTILFVQMSFAGHILSNSKEGESRYISKWDKRKIKRMIERSDTSKLKDDFNDFIENNPREITCSINLNKKIKQLLSENDLRFNKRGLKLFRNLNLIDDVTLSILLQSLKYSPKAPRQIDPIVLRNTELNDTLKNKFESFSKKIERKVCPTEAYRNLYHTIKSEAGSDSNDVIKSLTTLAFEQEVINEETRNMIEGLRSIKAQTINFEIKDYIKKKSFIGRQIDSDVDPTLYGPVDYASQKDESTGLSRREKLFKRYNGFQIFMMGEVIQKLRTRIETTAHMTVVLKNQEDEISEEIEILDPMDRFRFYLRLLRVEMNQLKTHTVFSGVSPEYVDIITAANELGYIPSSEINELVGLEDLWNPKKTFKEKVLSWVSSFGRISTVLIPQPYGFLASMALVLVDQNKEDDNDEFNHSLFLVN